MLNIALWRFRFGVHCLVFLVEYLSYRLTDNEGVIYDGYGNYSEDNKCTWLIAPDNNTQPIYLQFRQFSTECGWDHLYIYDGDSTLSPLLVAYR